MLKNPGKILTIILLLGLVLRLAGINHSFPFIFHPDEPTIIRSALGVRFDPNPGHFDWPHLYIYLNYFVYMFLAFIRDFLVNVGLKEIVSSAVPILWNDDLIFYLITRILTAVLGGFTVIPIYLTGKKLFNERVGLLSALCFSVFPYHVWHSHYSLSDVPMTFLLSWAIYFASRILTEEDFGNYSRSGFYFGLSASTKYNGGLGVFIIPLAHIIRNISHKVLRIPKENYYSLSHSLLYIVGAALFSILGFIIGTPYSLLDYKTFIRTDGPKGALWQFTNVGSINILEHREEFIRRIVENVNANLGYVVIPAVIFCVFLVLFRFIFKRYSKDDFHLLYLLIPALLFLIYITGYDKNRAHYYFIMYPYYSLVFGYFVSWLFNIIYNKVKLLSFIYLLLIFFPLFLEGVKSSYKFYNNDSRVVLLNWSKNYIKPGSSISYTGDGLSEVVKTIDRYAISVNDLRTYQPDTHFYISLEEKSPVAGYYNILNIDNTYHIGPDIFVYQKK